MCRCATGCDCDASECKGKAAFFAVINKAVCINVVVMADAGRFHVQGKKNAALVRESSTVAAELAKVETVEVAAKVAALCLIEDARSGSQETPERPAPEQSALGRREDMDLASAWVERVLDRQYGGAQKVEARGNGKPRFLRLSVARVPTSRSPKRRCPLSDTLASVAVAAAYRPCRDKPPRQHVIAGVAVWRFRRALGDHDSSYRVLLALRRWTDKWQVIVGSSRLCAAPSTVSRSPAST